jgi:adenylate cyclase
MGRITLRGRATPVEIFEPAPNLPRSDLSHIRVTLDRIAHGDAEGLVELEAIAAAHPDDEALGNLVYRMQSVESGGSYVLD